MSPLPGGKARPDVPRWRRGQTTQQPAPVLNVSGRHARKLAREMAAAVAAAAAAQAQAQPQPRPAGGPSAAARAAATSGAYRFRYQLVPFACAAAAGTGLGFHAAHAPGAACPAALGAAAVIAAASRGGGKFARRAGAGWAALTGVSLAALGFAGWTAPLPAVLALAWAPLAAVWCHQYRWRPHEADAPRGDEQIFARLAARKKWHGRLAGREEIPGGRRWQIDLDGAETDIGQVLAEPRRLAAAWNASCDQVYAERDKSGVESRGTLTVLRRSTLEQVQHWAPAGADPQTGIARVGRYADGLPAHIRLFARMDGTRHGLVAGTTGSGKSAYLDLLIRIALETGIVVPVVLDPQEGQSLPQWRGHLVYASGVEECMALLRRLHAGMLDRSRSLAGLRWTDEHGYQRDGMGFYDPYLSALPPPGADGPAQPLPVVLVIADEVPVLLTDSRFGEEAIWLLSDLGKRGRKTGMSLWAVAQIPSLAELGDQVLRAMLRGGNAVGLRTADSVSAGMIGLDADLSQIAPYFRNGQPTWGVGYLSGPDMRQAQFRADLPSPAVTARVPAVPALDPRLAAVLDGWQATASGLLVPPSSGPQLAAVPSPPPDADDEPEPEGRTAADAILIVLDDGPAPRAVIIQRAGRIATGRWGRARPFSIRAVSTALTRLVESGRIERAGGGDGRYRLARHGLHAVPEPADERRREGEDDEP